MSWFTKSFSMGTEEEEEDEDEEEEEEAEDDSLNLVAIASATGATVKEDFSNLRKTFTRQLWGVASFLAPPPPERPSDSGSTTGGGDGDVARGKGFAEERASDADTSNPSVATPPESGRKVGGDGFRDVEAGFPAVIELEKSASIMAKNDARGIANLQGAEAQNVVPEQNRGPERPKLTGLKNDFAELRGTMATGLSRISNVIRVVAGDDDNRREHDEKHLSFVSTGDNPRSFSSPGDDGDQRVNSPRRGFDSFLKPLFGNVLMREGSSSDAAKVGVHAEEGEVADSSTDTERSHSEIDSLQRELELIPSAIASGIDGLSKFAANLLNIVGDDEDEAKDEFEGQNPALGLTEAVVTFARNIAMHPETWLDFPLPETDNEFELTDAQKDHIQALKDVAPGLEALKAELCPNYMAEGRFWKIYFVLMHSRLNSNESPMLSTRQVVRARTAMLEELQKGELQGGDLHASQESAGSEQTIRDKFGARQESKKPEYGVGRDLPSSAAMARTSGTSSTSPIEDTRQPGKVNSTDPSVSGEARAIEYHPEPGRGRFSMDNNSNVEDDAEVDEWLDEEESSTPKQHGVVGAGGGAQGHSAVVSHINDDEEVSFSDLEEDESSSRVARTRGTVASSSPKSSDSGVAPDGAPTAPADASGSSTQGDSTPRKSSEFNDWLTVNQDDVASAGSSSP